MWRDRNHINGRCRATTARTQLASVVVMALVPPVTDRSSIDVGNMQASATDPVTR
jgi:hypothetical protein